MAAPEASAIEPDRTATSPRVALIRWPDEAAELEVLRASEVPRLLLVARDAAAPVSTECCEDWIRLPADDDDIRVRSEALAARARRHTSRPIVSGDGRIHFRDRWEPVSRTEELLLGALCDALGEVVSVATLIDASGDPTMTTNAVRVQMMRVRRRITPLGLSVRTVHGRGYVLETD